MQLISRDGSLAIISIGVSARGFVAIGGAMGVGVISFGGALSVGGIAFGLNSVGVVAIGMNSIGGVVLALINGLGGYVLAGVNSLGAVAAGSVNVGSYPVMGFLVMALGLALSLRSSLRRPARPAAPPWSSLARARVAGGFARVRLKWAEGERISVDDDVELEATPGAVAAASERVRAASGFPRALVRLGIAEEIVVGAATGYREAPPTQRVARVIEVVDPPVVGLLPHDAGELWWMLGWCARLAAVVGLIAATVGAG